MICVIDKIFMVMVNMLLLKGILMLGFVIVLVMVVQVDMEGMLKVQFLFLVLFFQMQGQVDVKRINRFGVSYIEMKLLMYCLIYCLMGDVLIKKLVLKLLIRVVVILVLLEVILLVIKLSFWVCLMLKLFFEVVVLKMSCEVLVVVVRGVVLVIVLIWMVRNEKRKVSRMVNRVRLGFIFYWKWKMIMEMMIVMRRLMSYIQFLICCFGGKGFLIMFLFLILGVLCLVKKLLDLLCLINILLMLLQFWFQMVLMLF